MKGKIVAVLILLLVMLSDTAWAVSECEELQFITVQTQVLPKWQKPELSLQNSGSIQDEPLYQDILKMFQQRLDRVDISSHELNENNGGKEKLLYYVTKVLYDHPEIYYARTGIGYYRYPDGRIISAVPMYIEELLTDDAQAEMDQNVIEAMELVADQGLTDTDKALILHDYLVEQVTYNWEVDVALRKGESMEEVEKRTGVRIYTAYGALVEGDAVCQGYALAYKLLLDRCGVDCKVVSSDRMNHVWNLVEIDRNWYHVDATWDDPVPDLPGYCGHGNFLRSDEGIKGDGPERGHYGWTVPDGITVSPEFEPTGLFRETNNRMYYNKGSYYYLESRYGKGNIWKANSLTDKAPELVIDEIQLFLHQFDGRYYNQYGIVWHEGMLYYVDKNKNLICLDLADQSYATLGVIPFEAENSRDNVYSSNYDTIGLYYNSQTGEIVAVSRTRPDMELAHVQLKEYPVKWDQMDKYTTALAGCVQRDDAVLLAGLIWAEEGQQASLMTAFYQEGRMVRVQMCSSADWTSGLNVLELDTTGYPAYDRVALFLLSDSAAPLCGAWQSSITE